MTPSLNYLIANILNKPIFFWVIFVKQASFYFLIQTQNNSFLPQKNKSTNNILCKTKRHPRAVSDIFTIFHEKIVIYSSYWLLLTYLSIIFNNY